MRIIAPLGMLLLTALVAAPVSAQMDLDSLLGELTYGESQLVSDNVDGSDTELLPPPAAEKDLAAEATEAPAASQSSPMPVNPGPPLPDTMLSERLKSRPQPAPTQSAPMTSPPMQGHTVISPPMEYGGSPPPTPQTMHTGDAYVPQHSLTSAPNPIGAGGDCGCSGGQTCQSCSAANGHRHRRLVGHHAEEACDSPYECRPHVRPNLPQASSFIQYFHSKNAHSNLWAGYEKEAQRRDDHHLRHVRGECDCLNEKSKKSCFSYRPPLYRAAAATKPCASCESGACDTHQHH